MAYLDDTGLAYFWGKIKGYVASALSPKANDADVVHKTGDETIGGLKVFENTFTTSSGHVNSNTSLVVPHVESGVVSEDDHFASFGFLDAEGTSWTNDGSRLAALAYKHESEVNPNNEIYLTTFGHSGRPTISMGLGVDGDKIPYAYAPNTSDERTSSRDIVTRGFMEASEWNWQKTKKAGAVTFKPVPESDLEPVVDFLFTETPSAEGEKGPDNPSTIGGVTQAKVTRCGKNLLQAVAGDANWYSISITRQSDGSYLLNGTSSSSQERYFPLTDCGNISSGPYATLKLDPAKTYTLSASVVSGTVTGRACIAAMSTANINWIKASDMSIEGGGTVTATRNASSLVTGEFICRLVVGSGTSFNNVVLRVQLEEGGTATDFEAPMDSSDINYTISLGDTYYGGSIDVNTGVMTVTHEVTVLNGTEGWTLDSSSTETLSAFLASNVLSYNPAPEYMGVCTHIPLYSGPATLNSFRVYTNKSVALRLDATDFPTADALKSWLQTQNSAGAPVKISYTLATPLTVQLTPTQIKSLPALDKYEPRINTVYTDQEAVQVGYQRYANYVDLTTDQTVAGYKTFRNAITMRCSTDLSPIVVVPADSMNDGTKRDRYIDAVVVKVADGISNNRLGVLRGYDINSGGNRQFGLTIYNTNNTTLTSLIVGALNISGSNPIPYAIAPSTPQYDQNGNDRTNGTDIVTRDWIPKDTRIVHTTGNETIGGEKTFTNYLNISKTTPVVSIINTSQNSGSYCDLRFRAAGGDYATTTIRDIYQGNFIIGHTYQGDVWGSGAALDFYYATGNFTLSACAGSNGTRRSLGGSPDGTLTWNGQTIQTTSDERLKTPLSEVPDAVLDAWEEVNWGQFQYLDAVAAKGDSARLHLGLIAQHVMSVFEKRGLDACDYGILCHEERPAVDEEETVVDAEAYTDEEGVEHPAVTHVETRHEDAVDLWMVRYAEAQAMEACCMRRENARLKKRIADLEERLAALELKIS